MSNHIPNGIPTPVQSLPVAAQSYPTSLQSMPVSAPLQPTWTGYVATTMDALILFEACMGGKLLHCPRRPHDRERGDTIKSGSVFIYEEHCSGIKRWTDGVPWSPSRILGNFLIYRELSNPFPPGHKKKAQKKKGAENGVVKPTSNPRATTISMPYLRTLRAKGPLGPNMAAEFEKALYGSLIDSYEFKPNGLVKKTISIAHKNYSHHLVSYYKAEDVINGNLMVPSECDRFAGMLPRMSIADPGLFRAPIHEDDNVFVAGPPQGYLPGYAMQYPQHTQQYAAVAPQRSYSEPQITMPGYSQPWPLAVPFPNGPQAHNMGQHQLHPSQHTHVNGYEQQVLPSQMTPSPQPHGSDHRRHTVFEANGNHQLAYAQPAPNRMPLNGHMQLSDVLQNHTMGQDGYTHGSDYAVPASSASTNGIMTPFDQHVAAGQTHQQSFDGIPQVTSAASNQMIAAYDPNVATGHHQQQHPSFDEHVSVTTPVSNQALPLFDVNSTPRRHHHHHQQHGSFDAGQLHHQHQPALEPEFFTSLQAGNNQGQLEFGVDETGSVDHGGIF